VELNADLEGKQIYRFLFFVTLKNKNEKVKTVFKEEELERLEAMQDQES
jgi:hypothetical protein